jgi:hypothetical protein
MPLIMQTVLLNLKQSHDTHINYMADKEVPAEFKKEQAT